jgi:large subunit ribosomal protein L29
VKIDDVREKTTEELVGLEKDLARDLWKSRFDNHTNQLDDTSKIGKLRKDIARIKTVLLERERQG